MRKQWVVRAVILAAAFAAGTAFAGYKILNVASALVYFPNVGITDRAIYTTSILGGVAGLILAALLMAIFQLWHYARALH